MSTPGDAVRERRRPRDFYIKPAAAGSAVDDTFLYLAAGEPRVQTVHARGWHYQLVTQPGPDIIGSYFAVLHGDVGDAALDLDVLRTPESDVAFTVSRGGAPARRFLQTNDSNTRRYEGCAPGHCHVLFVAITETSSSACPGKDNRIAILLDGDGSWRAFAVGGRATARHCNRKPASIEDIDGEAVLKDAASLCLHSQIIR